MKQELVLVDTSVWTCHLRDRDRDLAALLGEQRVLAHVFVIGELALGSLRQRPVVLAALHGLSQAVVARDEEVLRFIDRHALHGTGIGYVDAHLLASVRLTPDTVLWTRDKRLSAAAERLGVAVTAR